MAKKTKEPIDNYTEDTELDESYRTQQGVLDASKRKAQQNADVSYQMLQKYLPIQNRASGMHGLGVSEGAMIDANNRYMSRMGDIEANHAVGSATLLNNYRAEKTAAQDKAYAEAVATLGSGAYRSNEDIDQYLEGVVGKVSEQQADNLRKTADALRPEVAQTNHVEFKGFDGKSNLDAGQKIYLQDNYQDVYVVESGGEVSDAGVLESAKSVDNGEAFLLGGKIYMKRAGKVYLVNERKDETPDYYGVLYRQLSGEFTAEERAKKNTEQEYEEWVARKE